MSYTETVLDFAKKHPKGFRDKDLLMSLPEDQHLPALRELYRLALVDRAINVDLATEVFTPKTDE